MASLKGLRRKIGAIVYYPIAKRLPPSWSKLRVGQTSLRRWCGRMMLAECGKKVNIEQGAVFSPKVTLGDFSGIGINAKIYGACHIGRCPLAPSVAGREPRSSPNLLQRCLPLHHLRPRLSANDPVLCPTVCRVLMRLLRSDVPTGTIISGLTGSVKPFRKDYSKNCEFLG